MARKKRSNTVNRSNPYGKTTFSGKTVDNRTASALRWVAKRGKVPVIVVQGSYNPGGVGASGGTHDKGGTVDVHTASLSRSQRKRLLNYLKRAGFAAWYRPTVSGLWGEHIHAVLRKHKNLAPSAAQQVVAYDQHRDGLAGNRYDPTWRPKYPRVWSHRQNKPLIKKKGK